MQVQGGKTHRSFSSTGTTSSLISRTLMLPEEPTIPFLSSREVREASVGVESAPGRESERSCRNRKLV